MSYVFWFLLTGASLIFLLMGFLFTVVFVKASSPNMVWRNKATGEVITDPKIISAAHRAMALGAVWMYGFAILCHILSRIV